MDISLNEDQRAIEDGVAKICSRFGDDYWTECDTAPRFPVEFHKAMADAGFLGITMPEELGGSGLGVTEAAVMMHTVTQHGGGMAAASTIHINLFGPHPIVVHGTPEQKKRWLEPLIAGEQKSCVWRDRTECRPRHDLHRNLRAAHERGLRHPRRKMWTTTAQVADKILLLTRTTPKADCKRPTEGMTLFLHRSRSLQDRGPPHPEDGPLGGRFQRAVHRRS